MRIIREPSVHLVGRQTIDRSGLETLLADMGVAWDTDTDIAAQKLCEAAGRLCYMSFGKGRRTHAEYMANIIDSAHGSVLEHAVWNFVILGVSRSFTHELIRHRAGFGYSQLSQRYVDESVAEYVEPDVIADDPELHAIWSASVKQSHDAYCRLVEGLQRTYRDEPDATLRRKLARQAARSVLPNATETRIFVTGNARSWRHFVEARANEHAELEIRKVAVRVLRILQDEAPSIFGDYAIRTLADGTEVADTPHRKV